ncbi:MAG: hypothetical protein QNK05_23075 [Myxococcota bacterium]|nr:hypothetical protein [Myxococcota bacterium]
MQELGLFLLILIGLLGIGIAQALPALVLIEEGQALMLAAGAIGIPLQILYYTLLGVALTATQSRPAGWYWRPFAHHHLLTEVQRWVVLPVFYTGALSFLAILFGIGVTLLGLADLVLGE